MWRCLSTRETTIKHVSIHEHYFSLILIFRKLWISQNYSFYWSSDVICYDALKYLPPQFNNNLVCLIITGKRSSTLTTRFTCKIYVLGTSYIYNIVQTNTRQRVYFSNLYIQASFNDPLKHAHYSEWSTFLKHWMISPYSYSHSKIQFILSMK